MFKTIIFTSRPLLWLFHFSSVPFALALIDNPSTYRIIIAILILGLPFSLFIYGLNDIYDHDSDLINDRKGGLLGIKHNHKNFNLILRISLLGGMIFLLVSLYSGFASFLVSLLTLATLAAYSLPPFRLKRFAVIDNIVGGGLYALLVTIWSYSFLTNDFIKEGLNLNPLIFMFAVGFTLQSIGTIIDYIPDKKSNIASSSTILGRKVVAIYTGLVDLTLSFCISNNTVMKVVMLMFSIMAFSFVNKSVQESKLVRKKFAIIGIISSFLITLLVYFYNSDLLK